MNPRLIERILRIVIGLVWFINGLVCKVLNLVPRHQAIVSDILGEQFAGLLTRAIGLGEVFLAIWIWSGFRSRIVAVLQMVLVATMNVLEFFLAPELLLWGRLNAVFAAMFIGLVFFHEFIWKPKHGLVESTSIRS